VPVEFLTDEQAGAYERFSGLPSRVHLERFFFLDDEDRGLIGRRRGDHNRLGFAVQLTTVRFVGAFVADPVDVPGGVVEYVAEQLGVAAASMATYTQREKTRLEGVPLRNAAPSAK
jgi:TnpA family transposase